MWPFRYFPPRYWPSRYWARITGAVDPNALEGAAHGHATAHAALRGVGGLTAFLTSGATVQGDLTAGGTVTVGALAGTAPGNALAVGALVDGAAVSIPPWWAAGWGRRTRPAPAQVGRLSATVSGRSATQGELIGTIPASPLHGAASGSSTVTGSAVGRVTRGVLAARSIGRAATVARGRSVEADEMLFLLLAA